MKINIGDEDLNNGESQIRHVNKLYNLCTIY